MKKSTFLIIPTALITAIALFYAYSDWSGARQLQETLAILKAKEEPLSLEALLPNPIPDARNVAAAPIFQEIFTLQDHARLSKVVEPWKTDSQKGLQAHESLLHFRARQISPSFAGDDASAAKLILGALEPSTPLLTEVHEALARPEVYWPLDFSKLYGTSLPQVKGLLCAAKLLQIRALAEMATGSTERGFDDVRTMLALAKVSKEPHYLICELVEISILNLASGIINQALDHHAWNDAQLAMISEELAQPQLLLQYAQALRLERIFFLQTDLSNPEIMRLVEGISINPDEKKTLHSTDVLHAINPLRPAGWNSEDKSFYALTIQQMIDSLEAEGKISSPETWDDLTRHQNNPDWEFLRKPYTFLAIPSVAAAIKNICKSQTMLNSLRTACAVERYRLANDQLPPSLDALAPSLLPALPRDPMTGNPLLYKPSANGSFVIYGLGWQLKDEGGPKVSSFDKTAQKQSNWGIVVTVPK